MTTNGAKKFFGAWYGKVVLGVITAIAVTFTLWLASVPYRDRQDIVGRITTLEQLAVHRNERLIRIETNVEWIVKRLGGNP